LRFRKSIVFEKKKKTFNKESIREFKKKEKKGKGKEKERKFT